MSFHVSFDRGLLRVADDRVFSRSRARFVHTLDRHLRTDPGVLATRIDLDGGCVEVRWTGTDAGPAAEAFVRALSLATRSEPALSAGRPADAGHPPAVTLSGPRRALAVAAGGGCLVMTVVGAIVPGIPTVPFLLGASYFLARSSRRLHNALMTTPVVGRVVREWHAHRGISLRSKLMLMGMTVCIVLVTVSLASAGPVFLAVVAVVVSTSLVGIARIPGIRPAEPREDRLLLPHSSWAPRRLPLLPG